MTETRCATFDPTNGLGPALADAANAPDVVFPTMVHIDTDLGVVQDASNTPITVTSTLVAQTDGTMIRVLEGHSFVIDSAVVTGANALAIVAPGSITIRGAFDVSANGIVSGPGALDASAACAGADSHASCSGPCYDSGPGGGGNATVGGRGGHNGSSGGQISASFSPLSGGCPGGNVLDGTSILARGGGGGGALQLVSLTEVALTTAGIIDLGGGGGSKYSGGGSAGTLVIESPSVRLDGPVAGIAANGGSGGACNMSGTDGTATTSPAFGPRCSPDSAGDGSTSTSGATNGEDCSGTCAVFLEGGGGGASGRARIATKDGTFAETTNPLFSITVSTDILPVH